MKAFALVLGYVTLAGFALVAALFVLGGALALYGNVPRVRAARTERVLAALRSGHMYALDIARVARVSYGDLDPILEHLQDSGVVHVEPGDVDPSEEPRARRVRYVLSEGWA